MCRDKCDFSVLTGQNVCDGETKNEIKLSAKFLHYH